MDEKEYLLLHDTVEILEKHIKEMNHKKKLAEKALEKAKLEILDDYQNHGVIPAAPLEVRSVPRKLIVTDETKLPDKFFKIERTLKKAELNKAFQDGEELEGVTLDNGGITLAIRGSRNG